MAGPPSDRVPGLRYADGRALLVRIIVYVVVVAVAVAVFVGISYLNGLAGMLVGAFELAAGIAWLMGRATGRRDEVEGGQPRRSWLNPW